MPEEEWTVENERVVQWDREQTEYLRKRLASAKRLSIFQQPLPAGWRLVRDAQVTSELEKLHNEVSEMRKADPEPWEEYTGPAT